MRAPIPSPGRPPIRVRLTSDPMFLTGVRDMICAVAKRVGFPDAHGARIALAVDEALCNVICHGYARRPDAPIWLSLWPMREGDAVALRIEITDQARQVDPSTIRGRSLDDLRPGGLGVHIIREVMDEVTYERRGRTGMRLTLVKRYAPHADRQDRDDLTAGGRDA